MSLMTWEMSKAHMEWSAHNDTIAITHNDFLLLIKTNMIFCAFFGLMFIPPKKFNSPKIQLTSVFLESNHHVHPTLNKVDVSIMCCVPA